MPKNLLGRQPRVYRRTLPFSALLGAYTVLPPIPTHLNNGDDITNWGAMLNNQIGDCTCAAKYHGLQIWTHVARKWTVTEPDRDVLRLYMQFGYRPDDVNNPQSNSTDNGAVMQDVNKYITDTGMPIESVDGRVVHKLLGWCEVDHQNLDHVARSIYVSGGCDIGFAVPQYIMEQSSLTWDAPNSRTRHTQIVGGHDVYLKGYELDAQGLPKVFYLVSWGDEYEMTAAFYAKYVDESYMLASPSWLDRTGRTPSNLTKQQFVDMLKASW